MYYFTKYYPAYNHKCGCFQERICGPTVNMQHASLGLEDDAISRNVINVYKLYEKEILI